MVFEAFAASWHCLRPQTTSLHHLDARWLGSRQHILPARHSSPARHALQRSQQISSVQSPVASNTHCGDVLSWLIDHRDALPGTLRIQVQERDGQGRGLVSLGAEPHELLLSVPFDSVFEDLETDSSSHLPWNGRMAMRLLRHKHSCESGTEDEDCMCPWIESLPEEVHLPLFQYSVADLEACQDPEVIREAKCIRESAQSVYRSEREELAVIGYGWPELQWALSVLHSRCFTVGDPVVHLTSPGIDMANHSVNPNATVRIRHSPGAVQGLDALAEICDPPEPEPSRLELLAGSAGIRAGEEVQISYGQFSNAVFYLFFGFVPDDNPWESVTIFRDIHDMVTYHDTLESVESDASTTGRAKMIQDALARQNMSGAGSQLIALPSGYHLATVDAVRELLSAQAQTVGTLMRPAQYGQFLARRCRDLLDDYPTSYEHDRELLRRGKLKNALAMSLRYRMRQKEILLIACGLKSRVQHPEVSQT